MIDVRHILTQRISVQRIWVVLVAGSLALGMVVELARTLSQLLLWGWPGDASHLGPRLLLRALGVGLWHGLSLAALLVTVVLPLRWIRSWLAGGAWTVSSGSTRLALLLLGSALFLMLRGSVGEVWIEAISWRRPELMLPLELARELAVVAAIVLAVIALDRLSVAGRTRVSVSNRILIATGGVCLGLLGTLSVADWIAARSARPNILLLVVDCMRADHVGSYGYARDTTPVLDQIASGGLRFDRAYSTASWTKPALASLVTGAPPEGHGVIRPADRLGAEQTTLAERLASAGYRTLFVGSSSPWIDARSGLDQGYEVFRIEPEADAFRVVDALLRELDQGKRPFFAHAHFMDAHLPYSPHLSNDLFVPAHTGNPLIRPQQLDLTWVRQRTAAGMVDEEDQRRIVGLYDGALRFIDRQIGRLTSRLQASGQLENTLVVITSDHGEELWDHGGFEHGHTLYDELLHVPLLLSGPSIDPGRVGRPVSLLDIVPTLLELAGVEPGAGGQEGLGVSLLETQVPERLLPAVSTLYGADKFAVIAGTDKVILNGQVHEQALHPIGPAPRAELESYALAVDPGETSIVDPSESERMMSLYRAAEQLQQATLSGDRGKPSRDVLTASRPAADKRPD